MQIEAFQSLNRLFLKSYPTLSHREISTESDDLDRTTPPNFEILAGGIKDQLNVRVIEK